MFGLRRVPSRKMWWSMRALYVKDSTWRRQEDTSIINVYTVYIPAGYPASLLFLIMHPAHNNNYCHYLKLCRPPFKQYVTTHCNTEFIKAFPLHPLADLFIPTPTRLLMQQLSTKTNHSHFHHCLYPGTHLYR